MKPEKTSAGLSEPGEGVGGRGGGTWCHHPTCPTHIVHMPTHMLEARESGGISLSDPFCLISSKSF